MAALAVVAAAGPTEDAAVEVAHAVHRLREVRAPLGTVRATMAETDVVATFRSHHPFDADPAAGSPAGGDAGHLTPTGCVKPRGVALHSSACSTSAAVSCW